MKTSLMCMGLAVALGSTMAFAEEPAKAAPAAPAPAATAPAAAKPAAVRPKMTEAQRAEMKARREKFMAERRAATEKKMLEVVKKYVPEEEKAKALVKELTEAMRSSARGPVGHQLPPPARPAK